MFRNKNVLSSAALVCAVLALAASVFACCYAAGLSDRYEAQLEALNEQCLLLQAQLETSPPSQSDVYANLMITDWSAQDGTLTITTAFAQLLLPGEEAAAPSQARLVLKLSGAEQAAHEITLLPGEAAESFEADLTDISFQIPELSAEDTLELWLEATLSDGSITDTCGAGWFMENGRLMLVAG